MPQIRDLLAGLLRSPRREVAAAPPPPLQAPPAEAAVRAHVPAADAPAPNWPAWRLELMERLWGEGYTLPGGDAFVDRLAKPLTIGNSASVLYVGAGLGRPAERICDVFKSYVDGIDPDPELAKIAAARAARHDGIPRLTISAQPFDGAGDMGRRYDALIAQEVLLGVTGREGVLEAFAAAMKPAARIVLTDFVCTEDGGTPAVDEWVRRDLDGDAPMTEAALKVCLKRLKLKVRVFEDLSDEYVAMVLDGWRHFERILAEQPADREVIRGMLREAERWNRRVALLQSGDVRYVRVFAIAKG